MIRFSVVATYCTAGGNPGGCTFALVASSMDLARAMASRRIQCRGRSKIDITITREA